MRTRKLGRNFSYTPEQKDRVVQLSAQGMAQRKIAVLMGLSKSTIARILVGG